MSDQPIIAGPPPLWPRLLKGASLLVLAVLLVLGGWTGYCSAKLHLALQHAHRELDKKMLMRAEFWTSRALSVDPKNIDAIRMMAAIQEGQDHPTALGWRIRAAQLAPGNDEDLLAWAKVAFRFGQKDMALKALNSLSPAFQDHSADYHQLMAGHALDIHEAGLAEAHFLKAEELAPENPVARVNLAAFRLANSSSKEVRAAAQRDLEAAMNDPRALAFAVRPLLADAIRNHDRARARAFAEKLRALPKHSFADDLSCLEAAIGDPDFPANLKEIEHRAQSEPENIVQAGEWMLARGMAAEFQRWAAELPESMRSNTRVQMTVAETYPRLDDWKGLETFLSQCHWEDGEFLKHALQVRSQRALGQPWAKEWEQLVAEANAHPPNGYLLAQLVNSWQWHKEAIDLLWAAARQPKTTAAALQSLWDLYSRTNETHELWRVARAQLELDPSNPATKNNAAFLSLLVNGASARSETLARESLATNPNIPEWAATYAFALHLAGQEAEARKVMERLPPEALGRPGIALYYAMMLAATGDQQQAREALAKLNPRGMLPEEQKLAADLAQQLNVASR